MRGSWKVLVVIILIALGGYFFYSNPLNLTSSSTVKVNQLPFEDDFHLSKFLLSSGKVEYVFNVTEVPHRVEIQTFSKEEINFKLSRTRDNAVIREVKWSTGVWVNPILGPGTYIVEIEPSNSHADGKITIQYGFLGFTYQFIIFDATRENSKITIKYKDTLNVTRSIFISIKHRLVGFPIREVWNCTITGKNNFVQTIDLSKIEGAIANDRTYIIELQVDHKIFGTVTASKILLPPR